MCIRDRSSSTSLALLAKKSGDFPLGKKPGGDAKKMALVQGTVSIAWSCRAPKLMANEGGLEAAEEETEHKRKRSIHVDEREREEVGGGAVTVTAGRGAGMEGGAGGEATLAGGLGQSATGGAGSMTSGVGAATSSGAATVQTADAGTSGVSGARAHSVCEFALRFGADGAGADVPTDRGLKHGGAARGCAASRRAVVASPSSRRARRALLPPSLQNSKFKIWQRMRLNFEF